MYVATEPTILPVEKVIAPFSGDIKPGHTNTTVCVGGGGGGAITFSSIVWHACSRVLTHFYKTLTFIFTLCVRSRVE